MTTCENFGIYSHEQIHHEMYDGAGPSSQAEAMTGWHELAGRLTAIRHYVDSAISGVQESQQGAAADAAVGAMVPLGGWMDEAQRLADDTRDRIDQQISGFTMARDSVPEVPPEPRGWGWKDLPVIDSFATSDQEADEAFNAEQERRARAVMMAYQNGTNERVMSVPQFAPPPSGEPDLTIPTATRSAIGGVPGGVGGGPGAGGPVSAAPTSLAGVGGGAPVDLSSVSAGPPVGAGSGSPEHPGGRPSPAVPTIPGVPPGGPGGRVPVTPVAGGPRVPGTGGRPGAGRPGAGGGSAVPRGVPGVGGGSAAAGGRGLGGFGPERGVGGFGPAGSPESAARGAGPGVAGSGSAGAGSPGAAGMGRGAGVGGAGGMVPYGGMGQRGEDRERQRPSYLIEPDSNRLVGELPLTAPPVIGEDPPEYDERRR